MGWRGREAAQPRDGQHRQWPAGDDCATRFGSANLIGTLPRTARDGALAGLYRQAFNLRKHGPSLLARWEVPELATDAVLLRRGHPGRDKRRTTVVRSVPLPEDLWKELERTARSRNLDLHQAMRATLLGWIRRARMVSPPSASS